MGGCQSACGTRSYELEYYNEAYRHQIRQRARAKLVNEGLAGGGRELREAKRAVRRHTAASGRPTRFWMCEQGCCSIRWKLDYAEFQSYTLYAHASPYVVVQDTTGRCACVICRGCAKPPASSRHAEAAILRKVCEARRLDAGALAKLLPVSVDTAAKPPRSPPLLASEASTTDHTTDDDDDDDDGSI